MRLFELVGRARAEPILAEAMKRQLTSSFVRNSQGQNIVPRNFFDLVEAELRQFEIAASIPAQPSAPVRVEERDGKIVKISYGDSRLAVAERDFNSWREPILHHIAELLSGDFRQGTNHSRVRERLVALASLLEVSVPELKEKQLNP